MEPVSVFTDFSRTILHMENQTTNQPTHTAQITLQRAGWLPRSPLAQEETAESGGALGPLDGDEWQEETGEAYILTATLNMRKLPLPKGDF